MMTTKLGGKKDLKIHEMWGRKDLESSKMWGQKSLDIFENRGHQDLRDALLVQKYCKNLLGKGRISVSFNATP